jgi:peptide/nickel transport system substrate-binding protein
MVMNAVYEGLLRYAPDSVKPIGALARSYSVSPDGLTYTFHLRSGVTFHDGAPFNSTAVKSSFARRTAINQGPADMLAQVASVGTSDPMTAVVHLKSPVSAFLDYLAGPFSPRMVSPSLISKQAVGGDHAQKYLQTHDAGTGPYRIASFKPNRSYRLDRFAGYWGTAPAAKEVDFPIVPSIATQQLEFQGGQLDMITHGLTASALSAFSSDPKVAVHRYPTELKGILFLNPHRPVFADQRTRQAVEQLLDKKALTTAVYGTDGAPSTQIYPAGELPAGTQTSVVKLDPSVLKGLAGSLASKSVDIGFDSTDPRNQRLAELVGLALNGAGLKATTRAIPIGQIFELSKKPAAGPDILIQTTNPDAAHPDTWARIYMSKSGGANYLQCSVPAADKLLDAGLKAKDQATVQEDYGKAGNALVASGCFIDVADVQDAIVTRKNLGNLDHVPSAPFAVYLGSLR